MSNAIMSSLSLRCFDGLESETLSAILSSGRSPDTSDRGSLLTWLVTEQEYEEIAVEFNRVWDIADEVPFRDYMCGRGHVPIDAPEVLQWPPALCHSDVKGGSSGDGKQMNKKLLPNNSRMLHSANSASSLITDSDKESDEDQFFDVPDGHA